MEVIKNRKKLGTTRLRADALEITEAGYESINISHLFGKRVHVDEGYLDVSGERYRLADYEHVYVVGVGKGSVLAAENMEKLLGKQIAAGYVIDIQRRQLKRIKSFLGTHPLPSEKNRVATEKIITLLNRATYKDLVLAIICGGGSSLFCAPAGMSCVGLQDVFDHLLKSGATIQEMNTVRKHLSLIHGGYFAKYAHPATVVSMIISDVPGDDLTFVASGPTTLDPTSLDDAKRIAKKYGLEHLTFTETPKEHKYFDKIHNHIIASGSIVVDAMAERAKSLGYKTKIYSKKLSGLAHEVGPAMVTSVARGQALLACGETQVIVTNPGKGGRNQDVALSAVNDLPPNSVLVSAASDGKDNIEVAGAIVDNPTSVKALAKKHIHPTLAVEQNMSYKVLRSIKSLFYINKVTANVSDFLVVIRAGGDETY